MHIVIAVVNIDNKLIQTFNNSNILYSERYGNTTTATTTTSVSTIIIIIRPIIISIIITIIISSLHVVDNCVNISESTTRKVYNKVSEIYYLFYFINNILAWANTNTGWSKNGTIFCMP